MVLLICLRKPISLCSICLYIYIYMYMFPMSFVTPNFTDDIPYLLFIIYEKHEEIFFVRISKL